MTLTQADFTKNLIPLPTSPELWAGRKEPSSADYIKLRQRKTREWRWAAAVSRPDICARLERIAPRIDALCGSDVYRIHELVRVVEDWQQATALYVHRPPTRRRRWDLRTRGERVHWLNDPSGVVCYGVRGPVDGRRVPLGLCEGSMSHFAADFQIHQENGEEQSV